jgi:hypothetical protein
MLWIAKVQEPERDDEGKLIRDSEGNLSWGYHGRTYMQYGIINHKLPENHPKWVTVVPERWIRLDTKANIISIISFRGQRCTLFTEKDQGEYGVGYYGPRPDLRYPHIKGKIPEVIKPDQQSKTESSQPAVVKPKIPAGYSGSQWLLLCSLSGRGSECEQPPP